VDRGVLAGFHAVPELAPRPPLVVSTEHAGSRVQRQRVVPTKEVTHGGQLELPIGVLDEDPQGGQGAQQAVERRCVGRRLGGEVRNGTGAAAEQVCDAELGGDSHGPRPLVAPNNSHQFNELAGQGPGHVTSWQLTLIVEDTTRARLRHASRLPGCPRLRLRRRTVIRRQPARLR
jgi:hypothetical protein